MIRALPSLAAILLASVLALPAEGSDPRVGGGGFLSQGNSIPIPHMGGGTSASEAVSTLLGLQELEECSVDCQPEDPCTHAAGFAHHIAIRLIQPPQGMHNELRDGDHESCAEGACTYGFTHDGVYYEAKHPSCFVSGGGGASPDAATLIAAIESLGVAAERGDMEGFIAAAMVLRGRLDPVDGGSALQVYGCRGRIAGHVPITREQYVMLTAVE